MGVQEGGDKFGVRKCWRYVDMDKKNAGDKRKRQGL